MALGALFVTVKTHPNSTNTEKGRQANTRSVSLISTRTLKRSNFKSCLSWVSDGLAGEMATQTSAVVSLIPKYAVSSRKHTLMMLFQWPLPPSCEEQDDTKVTSVRVSQHTAQNSVALSNCESISATPTFMQTEATSH